MTDIMAVWGAWLKEKYPGEMSNDQAPMTNQTANCKKQCPDAGLPLVIVACRLIGHWCFVIGHLGRRH
jgi:hypothetical protein